MAGETWLRPVLAPALSGLLIAAAAACSRDELSAPGGPSAGVGYSAATRNIEDSEPSPASPPLTGEWRLIAIDRTQLSEGGTPMVVFGDQGHCWGSTGVNDFRTTFALEGLKYGRLKLGNAAVTRKMGPPEAMALEKLFLNRIESAISFEVNGDLLYLHSGENQNLTFERVYPQ